MDPMEEDMVGDGRLAKAANDWLPGDGVCDGVQYLPEIVQGIVEGAAQQDFHR